MGSRSNCRCSQQLTASSSPSRLCLPRRARAIPGQQSRRLRHRRLRRLCRTQSSFALSSRSTRRQQTTSRFAKAIECCSRSRMRAFWIYCSTSILIYLDSSFLVFDLVFACCFSRCPIVTADITSEAKFDTAAGTRIHSLLVHTFSGSRELILCA